jgi:hypothetical protein
MPAYLRLVAHPAERKAYELASHGPGNRASERRLADAGRPHEAQNRALGVLPQLAYREVFEDSVLDFVEAEVILVEDLAGVRDVEVVVGGDRPWEVREPLEVGPDHRVLRRLRRDDAQSLQLVVGSLARRLRQLRRVELLAQLLELRGAAVPLAELALDRPHLLPEIELLLVLRQLRLDLALDLRAELEELDLAIQDRRQPLQARSDVQRVEEVLLLLERDVQIRRDQVGDLARVLDVHHHELQLVGQIRDHRHELRELVHEVRLDGVEVLRGLVLVHQRPRAADEEGIVLEVVLDLDAAQSLDEDAHALIGVLEHLEQAAGRAPRVQAFGARLLVVRGLLRHQPEHAVSGEAVLDELQRRAARDRQRHDGRREDDHAAQRKNRQALGDRNAAGVLLEPIEPLAGGSALRLPFHFR